MTEPAPLSPPEQEELVREVGGMLLAKLPAGWQRANLSFRSTYGVDTATFIVTDSSGTEQRTPTPTSALRKMRELRNGMYEQDRGTWFTSTLTLEPPGRYQIDYDYDGEPTFVPPLKPSAYELDFEFFPRSDEHTPDWLREKLDEAQSNESGA
ncbi:hypothetical protein LFM09_15085 [Lentzea alba]|uniref:hypothetical protein n=1 Tax=Lentzea alba TaxID=2714351 RepID=UPI0039BED277